jgi:hypothetical protein
MFWRRGVQFSAGRIAALLQAGDEHLPDFDPVAFRHDARPAAHVSQHILDRFHRGNRMIEFRHARIGGMGVGIHETGQYESSRQINLLRARAAKSAHFLIRTDADNPIPLHGDGLPHGECRVDSGDLPVVKNQIRRGRLDETAARAQR